MPDTFRSGQINGVILRDLRKFRDSRGWLAEVFRHDDSRGSFIQ